VQIAVAHKTIIKEKAEFITESTAVYETTKHCIGLLPKYCVSNMQKTHLLY